MPRLLGSSGGGGGAAGDDDFFWLAVLFGAMTAAWLASVAVVLLRARRRGSGEAVDAEAPPLDLEMGAVVVSGGTRLLLR
jgi:hypothetical protein